MIAWILSWFIRPDQTKLVNAYVTHHDPPALVFPHVLLERRECSDPEIVKHLRDVATVVSDAVQRPMTAARYAVLRHLQRVRHHFALVVEPEQRSALTA
jgi:hypothetical protein